MTRAMAPMIMALGGLALTGGAAPVPEDGPGLLFHPRRVPLTRLKVELAAAGEAVPGKRGLVLPLRVTNGSAAAVATSLAREWHGGQWPPTSLSASVTPAAEKTPAPFSPVYV